MSAAVTIVIPHHRAEVLRDCLRSLFSCSGPSPRVIIVDDGPDAPSIQRASKEFPRIEVLRNQRNLGFSASCNRGLEAVRTRYAVLLNDDTRVTADWLDPLVAAADADPSIAACQPKLLSAGQPGRLDDGGGAGGYIDRLGFPFCRGRVLYHLERDRGQYDRQVPLFWACGSAMLLRLEAVRRVGFLDPEYYMHMEEIDLCWRLHLAGYRVMAVPSSVVYHHSGRSLQAATFRRAYLKHRNNLVMVCKNLGAGSLLRVLPLRCCLEVLASLGYLLKRQWRQVPAPVAALLWCLTHPLNLRRRRRQSRSLLQRGAAPVDDGVYQGSILYQYFVRGVRKASALMPEEGAS